jgi:hypothetical protein
MQEKFYIQNKSLRNPSLGLKPFLQLWLIYIPNRQMSSTKFASVRGKICGLKAGGRVESVGFSGKHLNNGITLKWLDADGTRGTFYFG